MSVRWNEQRKRWVVDVDFAHPNGLTERVRKTSPVNTRRGAEEFERKLRGELLADTYGQVTPEVPTLEAFSKEWIEKYVRVQNRPHDEWIKQGILDNHLLPTLGRHRLDQIGTREADALRAAKVAEGYAPKSVNHHLTALQGLLRVAKEWGLLRELPAIRRLPVPEPEFDWLTQEEAARLIAAAEGQLAAMIRVALHTGLRQGELVALRWEDVDLVARRLMVRRSAVNGNEAAPKSGKNREVPLSDGALAAFKDQQARSRLADRLVFPGPAGRLLCGNDLWWPLQRACRRAGLRPVGWHVLRHTFASWLVQRGARLKSVQELLGHSTQRMTERYAHLSPDVRREDVALLDRQPSGNLTATEVTSERK